MGRLGSFFARLTAKRVRLTQPAPGVEWAEGAIANGVRIGRWVERVGDATETTTWTAGKKNGLARRVRDDGQLVIERAWLDDRPHGDFRSFYDDGSPCCVCTYERGRIVGRYVSYAKGGLEILEGDYVDGERAGEFVTRNAAGVVLARESWSGGALEGPWTRFWDDGTRKLATTYRAGAPARFEIWTRAGRPLGRRTATTPEEAERFIDLAAALERDTHAAHSLVDYFPKAGAADVVALFEEQGFEGFTVYSLCSAWMQDVEEPRFAFVQSLVLDHAILSAPLMKALRASRRLRTLALHEVLIEGSLAELFASGAALQLKELALRECSGDVVEGLVVLAGSEAAAPLEKLTLDIEGPGFEDALVALAGSKHLRNLAELRVNGIDARRARELSEALGCRVMRRLDDALEDEA